jgi:hypothetical protein
MGLKEIQRSTICLNIPLFIVIILTYLLYILTIVHIADLRLKNKATEIKKKFQTHRQIICSISIYYKYITTKKCILNNRRNQIFKYLLD